MLRLLWSITNSCFLQSPGYLPFFNISIASAISSRRDPGLKYIAIRCLIVSDVAVPGKGLLIFKADRLGAHPYLVGFSCYMGRLLKGHFIHNYHSDGEIIDISSILIHERNH